MDNSNFRSFSIRPQKLKINPTYPSASRCVVPKNAPVLPRRTGDLFGRVWNFSTTFPTDIVFRTGKNGSAIFHSRPRMKVELTRENGRNTSTTGSKSYVWLLVRRIYGIASETQMISVEAVWFMPKRRNIHLSSSWKLTCFSLRTQEPAMKFNYTAHNWMAWLTFDIQNSICYAESSKCNWYRPTIRLQVDSPTPGIDLPIK